MIPGWREEQGMIQATQLKKGMCIRHDNELYRVVEAQHKTPGNLRGFVQAKIRSLRTGALNEHRFRSVDMVERAVMDQSEMEFLYHDGDLYHFMDSETFEQVALSSEVLGDAVDYLIPNIKLKVELYEGRPMGIELPQTVDLRVVETEPGIKGASVSNLGKPATLETGIVVQVPVFVNEGELIRVDTATRSYVERVNG
jgi:elongation factor P